MVMSPPRLWPLADCTTNYRPVFSSERAPQAEEQSNCLAKQKEEVKSGHGPQTRCPTPRYTDWLVVSRKVTLTLTLTLTKIHFVGIDTVATNLQRAFRLGIISRYSEASSRETQMGLYSGIPQASPSCVPLFIRSNTLFFFYPFVLTD
jgi:hypothetical protein